VSAAVDPRPAVEAGRGDLEVSVAWFDPERVAPPDGPEVRVWLSVPDVGGDRDAAVVEPWLSEAERARRARILHPRALAEFLAGRRLLRTLLAPLVGVAPAALRLVENRYGALSLDPAHHDPSWHFNLTHTDGLLALALARHPVGVDVEWTTRPGRTVELAERYFAKGEVSALCTLPSAAQRDRFFDLWTLKEAYIKARGMGLAIPLGDFAFTLSERSIAIAVAPSVADAPDAAWRFRLFQVGPFHRLAVALRLE
jgi:4'-phosphopantetheinyl transferase